MGQLQGGAEYNFGGFMKKGIMKAAAIVALTSVVLTCFPIDSVHASNSFVSAGGALATGMGSSLHDIRARIARNAAKQAVQSAHTKITSKDSTGEIILDNGDSDNMEELAGVELVSSAIKVPEPVDETTIEKVETPASKAVSESGQGGESVVGSAAETAQIELVSTGDDDKSVAEDGQQEASTSDDGVEDSNTEEGDSAEETENVEAELDAANPTIDIKPAAVDVEAGAEDLSDRVIADVEDEGYVRVRSLPSEEGDIVGKLYNHSAGIWLDKEGDWYKIKSGSVTGYVKGQYVKTGKAAIELAAEVGQRLAKVTTTTLKVRNDASPDASVLGLVPIEDELSVLEERDEWVKVSIEEGDGWVSKEFVKLSTYFPPAESKAEEEARLAKEEAARRKANAAASKAVKSSGGGGGASYSVAGNGLGAAVANYGLKFVGNPYVYGGTSLTNGTDCSGFTMGVYRNFGVSLPHSSGAQRSCGYGVASLAEAIPGDLICYSGHVAIYIGNGQIVHASTAATGIKVSNVSYRSILAIRRIF